MKRFKSDSEIVSKILSGDRDLYRRLVDSCSPMIFHLVRSFEKNEEEVKGMVQDIFVKAYTKLDLFDNRAKFSTWIYSIALNYCRDYAKNIRRNNSRFSDLGEDFIDGQASDFAGPDVSLEQQETEGALLRAIEKLPPEQADPLLMKYRDGMSYKTISEQTGISVSALKVRVHRARHELKRNLEEMVL